jgi:hypothetical protein
MLTKRKHKRFRADIPIQLALEDGAVHLLVPSVISVGGCFFDFPLPFDPGSKLTRVSIILATGEEVILDKPKLRKQSAGYFNTGELTGSVLTWDLPPDSIGKLESEIFARRIEPSTNKKVDFLISEQRELLHAIEQLEKGKHSGYKFIFTTIFAYMIFVSVPYQFPSFAGRELAGAYAIGGVWVSIALVFYADRFLRFIGTSYRRKAHYYKALSLNRSYIFANDGEYYRRTIFPLGILYDDARTWSYSSTKSKRKLEYFPGDMYYATFTTLYFLFIESLFVFGCFYFISIIIKITSGEELVTADSQINFFSFEHLGEALVSFSLILFGWLQITGNECAHYQRNIWEAKRITVSRPNVRASGEEFRSKPYFAIPAKIILWAYLAFGLGCLSSLHPWVRDNEFLMGHLFNPVTVIISAAALFAIKILHINIILSEENGKYESATPNFPAPNSGDG